MPSVQIQRLHQGRGEGSCQAQFSSSAKHHKAKGAQAGTGNIFQAFVQQDAKQREQKSCEEKARDAELIYLHHIEAHGIPPHVASCTTLLFKQMFPDSKIAEKFTFSDSKQGYEITHGPTLQHPVSQQVAAGVLQYKY